MRRVARGAFNRTAFSRLKLSRVSAQSLRDHEKSDCIWAGIDEFATSLSAFCRHRSFLDLSCDTALAVLCPSCGAFC